MTKLNINFLQKLPSSEKRITLPTIITLLRIILVPIIILLMTNYYWKAAFCLIIISAISDILDGMLARMRNERTILGACLDPIADKLFILSCYFILSLKYLPSFVLPFWFTWLIFFKELLLVLGAIILYNKECIEVKPTWLGKLTMDIQTIFIVFIFLSHFFNFHSEIINTRFLYIIVILTLYSFSQYAKIGTKQLEKKFKE